MWEYVIVGVIVFAAGAFGVYSLYRSLTGRGKCSCGQCPMKNYCDSNKTESK